MTKPSIAKASMRLIIGCSTALFVAAGSGVAFAHGHSHNGGDQNGNGGQSRCINCGKNNGDDRSDNNKKWSSDKKRHHHHPKKTSSRPPLHGPGSSHNPIVYHPPVKTIVGTKKPVLGTANPGSYGTPPIGSEGGRLAAGTVVRDHRHLNPWTGQPCQYTVGDQDSYQGYLHCEHPHHGGRH
jgi:hypothetical protein